MSSRKEIKLKAQVPDLSPFKDKLKTLAKFTKNADYVDYFFKSESGTPVSSLRLRNKDQNRIIIVKLLVDSNRVQINTEYKFGVDNPDECVSFLEALGFHAHLSLRKSSEVYFANDLRIELAKIDGLGNYVELTLHTTDEDLNAKVESVVAFAEKLGLKKQQFESRYYNQIREAL